MTLGLGPLLLRVPLELRQRIYEKLLALPGKDHISFLRTCKQIYNEGISTFYRRTVECCSQEALMQFTRSHCPDTLARITRLNMRFCEVDASIMQPTLALVAMGLAISAHQHPYFRELENIKSSLRLMPNVKQLSILRPLERIRNSPSRDFFEGLVTWMEENFTQLESLNLSISHFSLDFIARLRNLRSLQISGFSVNTPEELENIFRRSSRLEELIVRGPQSIMPRQRQHNQFPRYLKQTFTSEVLREMRPLKKLAIYEITSLSHGVSVFLDTKFCEALEATHRDSLHDLTVFSESSLSTKLAYLLGMFLSSNKKLKHVKLGWPGMDFSILGNLPTTLCSVEVVFFDTPHLEQKVELAVKWAGPNPLVYITNHNEI